MVWDLAQTLVDLGMDVHCISPYYNFGPKGETGYLSQYGVEYKPEIVVRVFAPGENCFGVHYGVVNGVKCWFLHNYTFFPTPYPTGSSRYRLQFLVVLAKASLELLCQIQMIPTLVVTNDWPTGLTAAFARHSFGSAFDGTKFLHIFHNLGGGYAGKLWPTECSTAALRDVHGLPDEVLVDEFDHSFDPSRAALLRTDQWATVSRRYRDDLLHTSTYRDFLGRFPHPFGASNGIRLAERRKQLAALNMTHEQAKAAVQEKYFGRADPSKVLFVSIGRIVEQKGVHLIVDTFDEVSRRHDDRYQVLLAGQAAPDDRSYGQPLCGRIWGLRSQCQDRFWGDPSLFFRDGVLALYGADFCLLPSLFEPSGIVQQEAFSGGTPVLAFNTGGLADTVFEFNTETGKGNGVVFLSHHHADFMMAVDRAFAFYANKEQYAKMRQNAYESTLSTEEVGVQWAREFCGMFRKLFKQKPREEEAQGTKG